MDVRCANCAAKIRLERDEPLVTCPYCGSTLYLDRGHTFLQFLVPAAVSPTQARDLLSQDLAEREVGPVAVLSVQGLLLPFWGVRGEALQESIAAFSPVPPDLAGYHLPSAGAVVFDGKTPEGFAAQPCGDLSSASWEGRADVASFGLYMVPFYKVTYRAGSTEYGAWVEAVSGRVYVARTPPSLSGAITHRFWTVLALLFALFAAEGLLVPGLMLSALVIAVTGALFFPMVRQALREGTA